MKVTGGLDVEWKEWGLFVTDLTWEDAVYNFKWVLTSTTFKIKPLPNFHL